MDTRTAAIGLGLAIGLMTPPLAHSGESSGWSVRGDTTSRIEYYDISGDRRLGSYAEDGLQAYQELNLGIRHDTGDGQRWDLDLSGVFSGSEYRTLDDGAHLEYVRLSYEDADGPAPYRLDLGDQRARFSRLSLDQDLRGVRLETQPRLGQTNHSLVWISGAYRRHWYGDDETLAPSLVAPEGDFHGASWLVADPVFGDISLNLAHHDQTAFTGAEDTHLVTSLALSREFQLLHQHLDAEAEWARLEGEQWSGVHQDPEQSVQDRGWHAQVSGRDDMLPLPVDYAVRYERYGEDFEPVGTKVVGDSRTLGASAGLSLNERVRLQGRYNRYVDQAAGLNPVRVDEHGMELAMPFAVGPVLSRQTLDVSHRERADRQGGIDQLTRRASWDMRLPLAATHEAQVELFWLDLDDRAADTLGRRERRLGLAHESRFRVGELDVTAAPGVAYRSRDGHLEQHTLSPTLSLAAAGALHELGVALGYRRLDRPGLVAPDAEEYHLAMDWRYRRDRHVLGVEYEHQLAEARSGEELDLWRAGLFWRYDFSRDSL